MITLLDGPLGTELIARGVSLDSDQWSADALVNAPELISQIHAEYLDAGAQVHTANTFRTGPTHCGVRWRDLARKAVTLAEEQIQNHTQKQPAKRPHLQMLRPLMLPTMLGNSPDRLPKMLPRITVSLAALAPSQIATGLIFLRD